MQNLKMNLFGSKVTLNTAHFYELTLIGPHLKGLKSLILTP